MRRAFGNPRYHMAMTALAGLIALGFFAGAGHAFDTGPAGGGAFLLAVGLIFSYWSWTISPWRLRRVPAERFQRRRDRLNALFAYLKLDSLVDPNWKEQHQKQ